MPDRWIRLCRRLVPEPLRADAFDPALADLLYEWVSAARRRPLALRWRVLALALACRRLHVSAALQSRRTMPMPRFHEVRLACRRLIRQPTFTLVAVATLAFGIGANLAIATFVDAFLLAPIAAPESGDLVRVRSVRDRDAGIISYPDYRDVREMAAGAIDLAAHAQSTVQIGSGDAAEVRTAELVTGNYFRVLRLSPLAGRLIDPGDEGAELAAPVVVVSEPFWRTRLARDPAAIGRPLLINNVPFEIVGVVPAGFRGTYAAHAVDLWVPLTMQQYVRPRGLSIERRTWGWLSMIGRPTAGADAAAIRQAIDRAETSMNERFPSGDSPFALGVAPALAVADADREMFAPVLTAAFALTALLFLATCANLAGVMHARLSARRRELAIRQSLGAGSGRLAWEWLAECTLLAVAGGAAGLLVARATTLALASVELPVQLVSDLTLEATIGPRVLLYAVGLSLLAGLLFGAGPAWRAARQLPLAYLRDDSATTTGGRRGVRLRRALVAIQSAISVVLLVTAALLAVSLMRQQTHDVGFDTGNLAVMAIDLRRQRVPPADQPALIARALDEVRSHPGVIAAAVAWRTPLEGGRDTMGISVPGYVPPNGRPFVSVDFNRVTAGFFDTLGVPFRGGRAWPATPTTGSAPEVVVNETMAARFWPGETAVGRSIQIIGGPLATVAGVVADTAYYEIGEAPMPYLFVPAEVDPPAYFTLQVRTATDAAAVIGPLRQRLAAADPRLTPFEALSFEQLRRVPLFPARLLAVVSAAFGMLALLLTGVGLYGVIASTVAQRTREIGVRVALGARPATLVAVVLRESLVTAVFGAAAGCAGAYLAAGALGGMLFGVGRFDAPVYLLVTAAIALLAIAAAWVPARRAASVDPVVALR